MDTEKTAQQVFPAHLKLQAWLNCHGKSRSWLATQCRVTNGAVTRWLQGKQTPAPIHRMVIGMLTSDYVLEADWDHV